MRLALSIVFSLLIIALLVCLVFAKQSKKPVSNVVAFVLLGMAIPVLGNLILIFSSERSMALIGFYTYFIGMDLAIFSLLTFTYIYCEFDKPKLPVWILVLSLFGIDRQQPA